FYSRDLFAFDGVIKKDVYFFGRDEIAYSIINKHKSNENTGLFGLRRTGKTSIIHKIQRILEQDEQAFVSIDCQNPAFHKRRWNSALYYILKEISEFYKLKVNIQSEDKFTEVEAASLFEKGILNIKQALGNRLILLIFDEIENITFGVSPSIHWEKDLDFIYFWQTLRSVYQKHNNIYTYLLVGTNPLCVEMPIISKKDNPIFNQIPYDYIQGFTVRQTREMVRTLGSAMGLRFDELLYSKLTDDLGGHPFLIRHVCSTINKLVPPERPVSVDKVTYEKAKHEFAEKYNSYLEMIINVLKEHFSDEYDMLTFLAIGDYDTFVKFAENSPLYTNHLIGYGLIARENDNYFFRIEIIKDYLSKMHRYEKLNMTTDEIWREIAERRNGLEPKLRMIVRSQLQAQLGKNIAKVEVLQVFGEPRKSKGNALAYEDLFNPSKIDIYFEDLRKIIIKHWNYFKNIFGPDKQKFDDQMHAINKNRNDAHAKEISKASHDVFRSAISDIEMKVSDFL
ncbi:ATP-binding protein, partial [Leptospira sp. id769339]